MAMGDIKKYYSSIAKMDNSVFTVNINSKYIIAIIMELSLSCQMQQKRGQSKSWIKVDSIDLHLLIKMDFHLFNVVPLSIINHAPQSQ